MTHSLRPYPEYKDSGSRWLGSIPAHWDIRAAKRLFAESGERARPDDIQLSATQSHGVIPQAEYERLVGRKVVRILNHLDKRKHVEKDDFVISMRSFQGGLERAWARGAIRSSYVVLKPVRDAHVEYFAHLFKSNPYIQALRATCQFIRDGQDLTFANFCQVPLPVVPANEQRVIAEFLDASAARIRRFIRNRRRLIEVLNEQKQAIINRAVTHGLDNSVPLRSSGIDWLGDIPAHWEVKPLKRWVSINKRVLPESTDPDYMFNYVDIGCVGTGRLTRPPSRIRFGDAPSRARRVLRRGDTILSTVRTYLRAVYFVADNVSDLVASTGFAVLTPEPGVVPEYLGITLQSDPFINRVTANSIGIAYPAIAETKLGTFHVAMPRTTTEQDEIVREVRSQTAAVIAAIERAQREIDLIREFRTRLIADVVTGKLDVRGFVPTEPTPADEPANEAIEEVGLEDEEAELVEEAVDAAD